MSGGGESGAVTVLFALGISALLLCAAFAVDTASWFHHRSHLQLQADAAAFAAASQFNYPCTKTVEQSIYGTAGQYGGVASVIAPGGKAESSTTPLYNPQVGQAPKSQGTVYEKINSKSYYGQPATDNTVEKPPCDPESTVIDVKMTETKLPGLFSVVGKIFNVPFVNAHARVSIVQQKYASAVEPLIESEPVEVRVFYVNDERCENSKKEFVTCADGTTTNYEQQQLATGLLTNVGSNEEKGTIKWTNASAPVPLNITAPHIGVRVALAGKIGALKGAGNETVAVCRHEYVECFDEDSGIVPPLAQIAGYSNEGTGKASPFEPVAHKVSLSTPSPNTCSDGYFALRVGPEQEKTCSMTVTAGIAYASASTKGVTVTPELVYTPGFSGGQKKVLQTAMTAPTLQPAEPWTGTINMPVSYYENVGSVQVNLVVKCKVETGSPCTKAEEKTLKDVQRAFAAGPDGSDRIVGLKVFEPGGANPVPGEKDANAFELCEAADANKCEHKLAVTVELKGSLEDATKYFNKEGKPIEPFHIVFADNDQESDDQFVISCPGTASKAGVIPLFEESLAHGCPGKYSVNSTGSCTTEKGAQEKVAAEEAKEKEQAKKEEEAKKARETTEAAERTKWANEEKETKINKAEREAKEAAQKTARAKIEAEEKAGVEKRAKEETEAKKAKELRETEETNVTAAKKTREMAEAGERAKWAAEEKETKITKAQREEKEKAKETKALWERQEGKGEITKAQREAKEKTKAQLEKERTEGKITKAQLEAKEKEPETKAFWERQEGKGEITKAQRTEKEVTKAQFEKEEKEFKLTKAQREEKELAQKVAREKFEVEEKAGIEKRAKEETEAQKAKEQRQTEEANITSARKIRETAEAGERSQWAAEEKEFKLTKAQREAKEATQKAAREKAEKEEAASRTKREAEEKATKEAREKLTSSAHECVGLVSVQNEFSAKHPQDEAELTAAFQNYLGKRVESPVNGLRYSCPNNWKNNNEGSIPIIPANDSRLIQFFVVPFTVTDFERYSSETAPLVPINNFATFYVTGWGSGNYEAGQGQKAWNPKERRDECSKKLFNKLPAAEKAELENEATPLKQREVKEKEKGFDDNTEQPREVIGHLIKYVNVLSESPGGVACKLEGLETCEATLTE